MIKLKQVTFFSSIPYNDMHMLTILYYIYLRV